MNHVLWKAPPRGTSRVCPAPLSVNAEPELGTLHQQAPNSHAEETTRLINGIDAPSAETPPRPPQGRTPHSRTSSPQDSLNQGNATDNAKATPLRGCRDALLGVAVGQECGGRSRGPWAGGAAPSPRSQREGGAQPAAVPPPARAPGLSHPARDAPPAPSHMTPPPPQTFSSPSCRGSEGMENGGLGAEFPARAAAAAVPAAGGARPARRHDALGAHQAGGEVRRG